MAVASYFDTVQKIYIAFYQRPADPAGLYYWSQLLDINGGDLTAVIDGFANSAEAIRLYDKNADGAVNLDDASAMLDDVFMALFNRAPDPAGKQFYLDALTAGKFPDGRVATVGRVVLDVLNGATSADAIAVSNKLEYATAFTKTLDPELDGIGPFQATYNGDDEAGARTLLAAVTADPTTRKTAAQVAGEVQSGIADAGDPILNQQTTGQTFTLTTSIEQKTGGATDDTFSGLFGTSNTADTLNTADVLDGAAGNDTLNLIATGTAASGTATISNIETINVKDVVGASLTATIATGVKNVNFTDTIAGNTSTVTGLTDLATVVGITGKGNLTVGYNAATVGGTADEAKVAINGIGSKAADGTITRATVDVSNANKIEKLNLAVTGDNYVSVATDTALGTITVTGAGTLNLRGASGVDLPSETTNSTLKVDASAATGAQNYSFAAGAVDVTGGAGNDSFAFGTTLGSTDKVDGGAGADSLSFELGTAVQVLPTIANVETLAAKFTAAGIVNASKITGATTIGTEVTDSTAVTYVNLANTVTTLNFNKENNTNTTQSGAVSVSYVSGAKAAVTLNIGEQNSTTATGDTIDLGGVTLANVDSLTINSVRDADNTTAVTNTLNNLDVGTATTLTVKTSSLANVNTGTLTGASVTKLTVNADGGAATTSTFTGAALTDLVLTSANKGALTTGVVGQAGNTSGGVDTTASKLVNYSVTTGATTTVNLGAVDAAVESTSSVAAASALKTISYDLGSAATVTAIGAVDASDENGGGTNFGSGVAQLDSISYKLGADSATASVTVGAIKARSVTTAAFTVADQASAHADAATLNMDESIGAVTVTAGKNETFTLNVDGLDDNAATDLYTLNVSSITGSGAGNVALAIGATATTVKTVGSIDLSSVAGTSQVVFSNDLTGTTGVTITIGSGGTTSTGVSGSNNADIITGGAKADTILGRAGADQITGGLGADVITGGAGQDTIDLTEATQSADTLKYAESAAANVDTVTGFKVGTDIISFSIGNIAQAGVGNATLSTGNGTDISGTVAAGNAVFTAVAKNALVTNDATTTLLKFTATDATSFLTAIGSGTYGVTDGNFTAASEGIAAVYFDSANGQAVFGYVLDNSTTTANVINSDDQFVEVTRVGMTSTDFTALNNTSFSLF